MSANAKYKDTVFVRLFSDEALLRELYSAISGVHYDDSVPLTINTLSDVLFNNRKNDISFLLDEKIVILIEHQSTINENMALRFLIYIARIYEKLVDNESIYRRKQVPIPQPEFIVLYNGVDDCPDYSEIKLSDAFIKAGNEKPALDLTVKIYNINTGKNLPLLQKSKSLTDYAAFTTKVREFQAELKGTQDSKKTLEEAIKKAIQWCVKQNVLKHFLQENGSEVENMVFSEWDMGTALKVAKEEGVEEGMENVLELLDNDQREYIKQKLLQKSAYATSHSAGIALN
ncbi:MAG: Rpn family recombination-promoting nuclease/putative transposase [Treponemataceae bacterium]|nr:MAG: Rpn family recombination-promoting nuclease/putative transposase [Treponemataceae bacterium]